MSEATIDLIDRLVARFPGLKPLLREHLAENFGVVLPHVFMGDLTRHVVSAFTRSRDIEHIWALLDELEQSFSRGDEETIELIAVSFLENLPRIGEEGAGVRVLLGPSLRSQLERLG